MLPHRDVRRSPRFEAELAAIDASVRRTDEALKYVDELLAKTPTAGLRSNTPGIWFAPLQMPADGGIVSVDIGYTFDDRYVDYLTIQRR
jgi:hypothetical protein